MIHQIHQPVFNLTKGEQGSEMMSSVEQPRNVYDGHATSALSESDTQTYESVMSVIDAAGRFLTRTILCIVWDETSMQLSRLSHRRPGASNPLKRLCVCDKVQHPRLSRLT